MANAGRLAGMTLADLARQNHIPVPANLQGHKGWIGDLLETALGSNAGNRAAPDFLHLGVELKTIPVDLTGKPVESTYVCSIPLMQVDLDWHQSVVWQKLQRVLWIPVASDSTDSLAARRIGTPLLWSPSTKQAAELQQDWLDIMETIIQGRVESLDARRGRWLQVRPKAASSRERCWAIDENGERFQTLPRGFYLRAGFTRQILQEYFNPSA
jgi:DNA mismatch repair protein MutH